jgi:hypothetical protein
MKFHSKEFVFHYPLKRKSIRNLRIVTEHVGDLIVEGVGYFDPSASVLDIFDRYSVDIDFVKWKGIDIKEVLDVTGGLDEVIDAAHRHFASTYEDMMRKAA